MSIKVSLGNESQVFESQDEAFKYGDSLHERLGGVPKFETVQAVQPVSEFGGNLVHDEAAKVRIEALHSKLGEAGVTVNATEQLYNTGTRLAQVGYDTQAARKAEHDAKTSVIEASNALREIVKSEKREDIVITAGELASKIAVNGFATVLGFKLTEQAVRGLTTRLGSPALGYILGLRDRVRTELSKEESKRDTKAILADKNEIANTLRHECLRFSDTKIKLRARTGSLKDVFAIVSPTYAPADAPEVLDEILTGLPSEAKASFAYDPTSTNWELRAEVWTPTPVDQQAVGEPFEGYVSFSSRDDGTSRFRGGGGVNLLRCLNASTYVANGADVSRVHRGDILFDISKVLKGSTTAIRALCDAWGYSREAEVAIPKGITIEDAIPGFYRSLLTERRGELAGVLRGRTEDRVKGLTAAFWDERRNPEKLVRSDFAQGWTKFVQKEPAASRREAEVAIGDWLVNNKKPLGYVAAE